MDWNRTKTIFIFVFLLLNGFLFVQMYDRMESGENNVEIGDDLETHLDHQDIEMDADLPDETIALSVVRTQTMESLPEEVEDSYDNADLISEIEFNAETGELTAWLEEPYELDEANAWSERRGFIDNYVYEGEDYRFAGVDELQTDYYNNHEGRTLIAPSNTHLTLYENDDGDIESFTQRFIQTEDMAEQSISPAIEAVDTLIRENEITNHSIVTNVDHVYYSALSEEYASNEVMYAPYYRIVVQEDVEEEEERPNVYLVSAVEGEETIREP